MQAMDDLMLLREYAASRSETAFETLVSRHLRDWTFRGSPRSDWAYRKEQPPALKPGSEVAWIGSNPFVGPKGEKLRVYKSTFENSYPKKTVASIEYVSAKTDCAPFLLGLSLE
jgi:hypothetical protein